MVAIPGGHCIPHRILGAGVLDAAQWQGFRLLTPGSFVAVTLWLALSFGFRLYITQFGRFNILFGSIGAVIVLLLFLWFSSIVLLVGGEINAILAQTSATEPNGLREPGSDRRGS